MSDIADLSRTSCSERIVNSWESKEGSEKLAIMICILLSFMVLGFTIGVISLKTTEHECEEVISQLKKELEECLNRTTTIFSTIVTGSTTFTTPLVTNSLNNDL
ncbi:uncharacterized protein [Palaemon carinicauda]|uniref:uncharacterized protein n=1 Tax=Palaemon carinicauda TaxID=392227 RepID=UPI0035B578FD